MGLASILSLRLKGRPFDLLESLFRTQRRAGWWQRLLASQFYLMLRQIPKLLLSLVSIALDDLIYSAFGAFKAEYSQ